MIEAIFYAALGAIILAAPSIALHYTTRRRPLVVRETPTISSLPRGVAIPTVWRKGKRK